MHNVVRLPEQRHLGPDRLATEVEALAAARQVAARIAQRDTLALTDTSPVREMEWVAQAGLLGISIPAEFGGPDMANAVIADIVSILAQAEPQVGQSIKGHYRVIEALRIGGSHEQQKVFFAHARAGEHFHLAIERDPWEDWSLDEIKLINDRTGYRLSGAVISPTALLSNWIVVPAMDPKACSVLVLLDRAVQDLAFPTVTGFPYGRSDDLPAIAMEPVHVPPDAVIPVAFAPEASQSTLQSLNRILDAATSLGLARSVFTHLCHHLRKGALAPACGETIQSAGDLDQCVGRLSARIEGVSATVERAGQHLDMAQVDTSAQSLHQASLSTSAALVLACDLALDILTAFIEVSNPPPAHAAHDNRRLLKAFGRSPRSLAHLSQQALSGN